MLCRSYFLVCVRLAHESSGRARAQRRASGAEARERRRGARAAQIAPIYPHVANPPQAAQTRSELSGLPAFMRTPLGLTKMPLQFRVVRRSKLQRAQKFSFSFSKLRTAACKRMFCKREIEQIACANIRADNHANDNRAAVEERNFAFERDAAPLGGNGSGAARA